MKVYLFDLSPMHCEDGDMLMATFIDESGKSHAKRIVDTPHVILTDPLTPTQLRELEYQLSKASTSVKCLDPACGCTYNNIIEEDEPEWMCQQKVPRIHHPILHRSEVDRLPFLLYNKTKRRYTRLVLARADLCSATAKFMRGLGLRAYNYFSTAVENFHVQKNAASFEWYEVPDTPEVSVWDIRPIPTGQMIPPNVLSLDIETVAKKYRDSETHVAKYPIGMIGLYWKGERINFHFKATGVAEQDIQLERDMLVQFFKWFRETDPNVIIGYNINAFDLPYICRRAMQLGFNAQKAHQWLSRYEECPVVFQNLIVKARDQVRVYVPGRLVIDVYMYVQTPEARISLHSYKLAAVCKYLKIKLEKGDVKYSEIYNLFYHGGQAGLDRLIKYCELDAELAWRIFDKLKLIYVCVGKCLEFRMRAQDTMYRAIMYCNWFKTHHEIEACEMVYAPYKGFPGLAPEFAQVKGYKELYDAKVKEGKKFEGAYVHTPVPGLHKGPVATNDFSSLYPSNFISDNICLSTMLPSIEGADNVLPQIPGYTGPKFAFTREREGVIPRVLKRGVATRNEIRKRMKTCTDPVMYAVLDGQQNAIKLSNNSMYGAVGAVASNMSNIAAAQVCTQQGKHRILQCIEFVEGEDNGDGKQKTVYGDTDSIFVQLPCKVYEGWAYAKAVHRRLHSPDVGIMVREMKMALENVSASMLSLCKKKYVLELLPHTPVERCKGCGKITCHENPRYLKIQGVLNRSIPPFTQNLITEMYKRYFLKHEDPEVTLKWIHDQLNAVREGRVDLSEFTQSRLLSKPLHEYKGIQIHTECARMLMEADIEVKVGDRIEFANVINPGSTKKSTSVVPIQLIDQYTVDWKEYFDMCLQTLERVGLEFMYGKERLKRIRWLANMGRGSVGRIQIGAGALASHKTKKDDTVEGFKALYKKMKMDQGT